MYSAKFFFCHIKSSLLGCFKSLKTHKTKSKQFISRCIRDFNSMLHELKTFDFTELGKECVKFLSQIWNRSHTICREAFKVKIISGKVFHKLECVLSQEPCSVLFLLALCYVESLIFFILS